MKRPFCVIGCTMLFVLFLLQAGSSTAVRSTVFWTALILCALTLCVKGSRKDRTLPTAFLCAALCVLLLGTAQSRLEGQRARYADRTVTVSGTLCELPYTKNGTFYYVLQTAYIGQEKENMKIRLASRQPIDLQPGDRLTAAVHCYTLGEKAKDRSVQMQFRAKNLNFGAYPAGELHIERAKVHTLPALMLKLRAAMVRVIRQTVPEDAAAVLCAMCLGDSLAMPLQLQNAFRATGTAHLLVVSGLHLSVFGGFFYTVLRQLGLRRRQRAACGILFTVLFTLLTGGAPSVVRAAVLLCTVYAADLFRREADACNSVGIALTGILLANPFAARSLSLLLSVLATFGVLLLSNPIVQKLLSLPFFQRCKKYKWLYKLLKFCMTVLAVTGSVTLFTLPVQILFFAVFAKTALPANLLLLPVTDFVLLFGMLGAVCGVLSCPALARLFFFPAVWLSRYLCAVTHGLSRLPHALLYMEEPMYGYLLAAFLAAAAGILLLRRVQGRQLAAVLLTFVFLFSVTDFYYTADKKQTVELTAVETQTGLAVLLHCGRENILLTDTQDVYAEHEICAILYTYGAAQLDAVFLQSPSAKAADTVRKVDAVFPVQRLCTLSAADTEVLGFSAYAAETRTTQIPFSNGLGTVRTVRENSSNLLKISYGACTVLLSFSAQNDLHGEGAAVFMSAEALPYGFAPQAFSSILLAANTAGQADFLTLQGRTVYTLAQNGSLTLCIRQNGSCTWKKRR